jgi:ribosomal protein S8
MSCIKNAKNANLNYVLLPGRTNKFSDNFLKILYKEGFIQGYFTGKTEKGINVVYIKFRFQEEGKNVLNSIVIISSPGKKIYTKIKSL